MVLSATTHRWTKVAMIIGRVLAECESKAMHVNEYDVADRIRALLEKGKLQAGGNISLGGTAKSGGLIEIDLKLRAR